MMAFFELYVSSFWVWAGITFGMVAVLTCVGTIADSIVRGRK